MTTSKVFLQQEEELGAPLLEGEEDDDSGDLFLTSNIPRMETEAPSSSHQHTSIMSSGPMAHPSVRRAIYWALGVRTVADALPELLHIVVNSGKLSIAFFLGGYFVLVALWFPFWLFSFVIGEKGIYTMMIGAVFLIGRGVIRMIAFPGSSNVSTWFAVCVYQQ